MDSFKINIESNVPKFSQKVFAEIMSKHPKGLEVSDLNDLYKKETGYPPDTLGWGLMSMGGVVDSLENVFRLGLLVYFV